MRPDTFTLSSDSHDQDTTPADQTTVITLAPPVGAAAVLIAVQTTNARVTFDGSTPAAANGLVWLKDLEPVFLPVAPTIKWISTANAASVVSVCWLF